ncbi:MAG: hypothetical protein UU81_C0041G0007 [Microgenomates group bacterium GW2011_GWC1_41_8]|uniref:Uncharacterized protein n=3 Tax=Candidatus Roizmaniibacteriota TaxID=1752723 RepID=A0A0G0XAR9_9BACT|nr:MAG: hypothetical protein UU14_C0008G0006 [Candidatus Roizmanbacteria bacterium GW2011_GWB1_40_7]KKR94262.1 MAG: hypothetical protein UU41_C0009G0008 [Candidatus Roizmanbacteria bacterium GW2011_GWA1_41_13]KKS22079.1 MAG: hypothetical protein UU78_C0023G0005 [Candidatus Roizmanbacteria bacterium GW2011_GWC2_41_7]KKS23069.1 MAG: hypothetical protein UU81_C0041G0007 [Microgenomates group bacterium GW2011_GWC1_41_8]
MLCYNVTTTPITESGSWISNETVIAMREKPYIEVWGNFQDEVYRLKEEYGNWESIPNSERTRMADELRGAGWIYGMSGWEMPNSVALSSVHYL